MSSYFRSRTLAPSIEFTVLSGDPAWTSRRYGVQSLHRPQIPDGHTAGSWTRRLAGGDQAAWSDWLGEKICTALRNCVGVFVSGGGNLTASWPEHILERVALIEVAHQHAIPAVVTGQTVGPVITPDQRQLLAVSLPKLRWLGVRDADSAALARDLGVPAEAIHQQLDDAFLLEPLAPAGDIDARFRSRQRWIAVTLDASFAAPGRSRAIEVLAGQLDSLAEHLGASIAFVPHVAGDGSADAPAGRALAACLRSPLLQLDLMEPREVRWLVEKAALVISTRYHPLVFAFAAGTPALGIWTDAYTRVKLRGAMSPAGLEGYAIPLEEAERGAFLPLAMELWHWRDAVRKQLARLNGKAQAWEVERWDGICRSLTVGSYADAPLEPHPVSIGQVGPFVSSVPAILSEGQWHRYDRDGYLRLGKLLDDEELTSLRERMDAIMLGRIHYPTLQMQLDTGGRYEELPDPVETFLGETLRYRKIQGLEVDPLVLEFIRSDLFREICARHYGAHTAVSVFRIMMMNKPAGQGTYLPWHQDAGDVWKLDRDPLVTLWVALDPSTRANGCVQVIPGTHRLGLLSRNGSNISAADTERYCPEGAIEYLEMEPGEGLLLHNWLLHRSDVNRTETPRRALSACYMDGRTVNTLSGKRYPIVFGDYPDVEATMPFLRAIQEENRHLRHAADEAARFAKSLLDDNQRREQMRCEAETYAKSLEAERDRLRKFQASAGVP